MSDDLSGRCPLCRKHFRPHEGKAILTGLGSDVSHNLTYTVVCWRCERDDRAAKMGPLKLMQANR